MITEPSPFSPIPRLLQLHMLQLIPYVGLSAISSISISPSTSMSCLLERLIFLIVSVAILLASLTTIVAVPRLNPLHFLEVHTHRSSPASSKKGPKPTSNIWDTSMTSFSERFRPRYNSQHEEYLHNSNYVMMM